MDTGEVEQIYSLLFDKITKTPTQYKLNKTMCSNVIKLDIDHANFILALIYNYYVVENKKKNVSTLDLVKSASKKSNIVSVPYGGKTHDNGKGPQFENILSKFPITLQQLIAAYMEYISE